MSIDLSVPKLVVRAGAGAGKTTMLVNRYLHHLTVDHLMPLEIVAITFTEAAADQLRQRIRTAVTVELNKNDDRIAELEAARIGTIHSLAAVICRQHPTEAGVPPDFSILDDLQGPIWVLERLNDALDELDPATMRLIPFSRMRTSIRELMTDPFMAQAALRIDGEQTIRDWIVRSKIGLTESGSWLMARSILMRETGPTGDRLELNRRTALEVLFGLESEDAIEPHLRTLAAINLQGGSSTAWGKERFESVKEAIKTIRDQINSSLKPMVETMDVDIDYSLLKIMLADLAKAYDQVQKTIDAAKKRRRLLDYNDLEVHAMRALESAEVRSFYHRRWRAFLIDEFQDTNPIQADILTSLLAGGARVVLVGDKNQSIYGFRGADPELFTRFEEELVNSGGTSDKLDTNYRSRPELVEQFNALFPPLLNDNLQQGFGYMHQNTPLEPLEKGRKRLRTARIISQSFEGTVRGRSEDIRRIEAASIARQLRNVVDKGSETYDGDIKGWRGTQWRDIAILARTSATLDVISEALGGVGIPYVNTGGGSLLQTREAKDGVVLLRFLAEPSDNLALASVLRSPFCTISDRQLQKFAAVVKSENAKTSGRPEWRSWWSILLERQPQDMKLSIDLLEALLAARSREIPGRILHLADRMSGYSAVLLGLPNGRRRAADWQGFRDLVTRIEVESGDVFAVSRILARLTAAEQSRETKIRIPRPTLEPGNAVSLMTIHRSKGLEWPIVVVPDLKRSSPGYTGPLLFDRGLGVGLKLQGEGSGASNLLYGIINQRRTEREMAEDRRVLYVACTRAKEQLLLTESGGSKPMENLTAALEAANVPREFFAYKEEDALPPEPQKVELPGKPTHRVLGPVSISPSEIPITALQDYLRCPKRFEYRHIIGHRGLGEGNSAAARIGTLVHLTLQHGWTTVAQVVRADPNLHAADYDSVLHLAEQFRNNPVYSKFREPTARFEVPVRLQRAGISLTGRIDLLGRDFILDFKTPIATGNSAHRIQLWAYAEATGIRNTSLAFLSNGTLSTVPERDLDDAGDIALEVLKSIVKADFTPAPERKKCLFCPYQTICLDSLSRQRSD